jgi:hypothetical protein
MTQHHAGRRRGSAAHHVLVRATNIRRNDFQDDPVLDRLSRRIAEGGKVDVLNLDLAGSEINDTAIGRYSRFLFQICQNQLQMSVGSGEAETSVTASP